MLVHSTDEPVFEWWNGPKKLTIYLDANDGKMRFVKVWGDDIDNEMDDGVVENIGVLHSLFSWLNGWS